MRHLQTYVCLITLTALAACSAAPQPKKPAGQQSMPLGGAQNAAPSLSAVPSTSALPTTSALPSTSADPLPPTPSSDPLVSAPPQEAFTPVPVFRGYNILMLPTRMWSGDQNEITSAGYTLEGAAFSVLKSSFQGAVPLYRCSTAAYVRFLSTGADCEGQQVDKLIGYIFAAQVANTVPLSRCAFMPGGLFKDSLAVTSTAECVAAGFAVQGLLGYTPTQAFRP